MPHKTLKNVQALRAIAAATVLSYHVLYVLANRAGYAFIEPKVGACGVDLFFVISGFIMIYTAADLFGELGAPLAFLQKRIMRIVPLYWLCTTGVVLLLAFFPRLFATGSFDWTSVVSSYFFVLSQNSAGIGTVLQTGWTLCYEAYFYAIFALLLFWPRRFFWLSAAAIFCGGIEFGRLHGEVAPWARVAVDPLLLEFYAGAVLGALFLRGFVMPAIAAVIAIALAIVAIIAARNVDPGGWGRVIYWGIPCAVILLGAISLERKSLIAPALLVILGDSSYSLYLTHPFVLPVFGKLGAAFHVAARIPAFVFASAAFVVAIIVAHAVYLLIERPMISRLSKALGLRRIRPETPPASEPIGAEAVP